MEEPDALHLALSIYRQPLIKSTYLAKPYPKGMLRLIKIAAGSEDAGEIASQELHESPKVLRDVSVFYLQQILAKPRLDAYGLLCLAPGATAAEIATHKRWLLKWLHPDRNGNRWETVLFQRVLAASEKIEHENRQAAVTDVIPTELPGSLVSRTRKPRSQHRKRLEPVFIWRMLIRRALKSLVVLTAVILLVTGAVSRLSSSSSGNNNIATLLGW